jgi:hypothetical protein
MQKEREQWPTVPTESNGHYEDSYLGMQDELEECAELLEHLCDEVPACAHSDSTSTLMMRMRVPYNTEVLTTAQAH